MVSLQSKIKGALYGFAIGDAIGATTEFMTKEKIDAKYGRVTDILGGGWLKLKPGEVTDDTQMMLCVCDAILSAYSDTRHWSLIDYANEEEAMLGECTWNFTNWLSSGPKDVGATCSRSIRKGSKKCGDFRYWFKVAEDPESLGNGSLMRTLPIALCGLGCQAAISQGRLTHNNTTCDNALKIYYQNIEELLNHDTFRSTTRSFAEPTGHVINTLVNALFWVQHTNNLESAILNAVNHGGDADTIAAITGSLAGALYGYEAIPKRWIDKLDKDIKSLLDFYSEKFEKINKKVCTNLE